MSGQYEARWDCNAHTQDAHSNVTSKLYSRYSIHDMASALFSFVIVAVNSPRVENFWNLRNKKYQIRDNNGENKEQAAVGLNWIMLWHWRESHPTMGQ